MSYKRFSPPDNRPSSNRIMFQRRRTRFDMRGDVDLAAVVIDDVELEELFTKAAGTSVRPLEVSEVGFSLELWGPDAAALPREFDRLRPDGYIAVLSCGCGYFGCGGASARVEYNTRTVVWSDFGGPGGHNGVRLGPFAFDREDYELARRSF